MNFARSRAFSFLLDMSRLAAIWRKCYQVLPAGVLWIEAEYAPIWKFGSCVPELLTHEVPRPFRLFLLCALVDRAACLC